MRKFLPLLPLLWLIAPPAHAQQWLPGGTGIPIVCAYNSSPGTVATGLFIYAQCDSGGTLKTTASGGTVAANVTIVAPLGHATADTGAVSIVPSATAVFPASIGTWAAGTLGAMANYGTSPGAVLVPGVNSYCTNCGTAPPNDVTAGPQNFTGASTLAVNSQGAGAVGLLVTGTFTGAAWTLQGSVDGTTYATIPFWDNTANGTIYVAQPSTTAVGTYVAFAAGYKSIRINVTAVSTGTLVATLNSSAGSAQHPVSTQGTNTNINGVNNKTVDPCFGQTKLNAAFGTAGATNVQVVAGVSSQKVYICSMSLVSAAAAHFNVIEGTGAACVTANEAAVIGSTTAANGLAVATNGGLAYGGGGGIVGVTATAANGICILSDTSVQFGGNMTYIQQ